MIVEFVIFLVTSIVVYYVYRYKKAKYHFESRDVKFLPFWPFFGNSFSSLLQKRHMFEDIDDVYKAFPSERSVIIYLVLFIMMAQNINQGTAEAERKLLSCACYMRHK